MADPRNSAPPSTEEVISLIAKTAEELRLDEFRVRVQRRRPGNTLPEQILTLDGAKAEHFSAPETWLPRIAGGGLFLLTAFHVSNNSQPVGGPFPVQVEGAMRDADVSVLTSDDWTGPRICVFPTPAMNSAARRARGGAVADLTPLSGGHDASPRTIAPEASGAGGSFSAALQAQFAEVQRQKEALAEEKRKLEVDAVRKESQIAVERAERRAEEAVKAQRSAPPPVPVESGIEKMLAGVLPLAMKWFESQQESRAAEKAEQQRMQFELAKMQHETQLAIARAQSEATAKAAELQARAAEVQSQMQMQLAAKADESNKFLLQALLNKPQDDSASKTGELVASMAGTTMNVLNTMVELGLTGGRQEPEEPTALKAVREVVRGIALMSSNAAARALPAAPPNMGAPPQQQQQQQQEEPAEEEEPPAPAPLRAAEPTLYDRLVVAIRDTRTPPKDIAQTILQSLADPSLIAAYTRSGGDLRGMFAKDLDTWLDAPANKARLRSILAETVTQGVAAGVFPEEAAKELEEMLTDI